MRPATSDASFLVMRRMMALGPAHTGEGEQVINELAHLNARRREIRISVSTCVRPNRFALARNHPRVIR